MGIWTFFQSQEPARPKPAELSLRIKTISIVPHTCICCQMCIGEVPDVLEWDDEEGIPRLIEGAEALFESKVHEIQEAYKSCPVDAIRLVTE